MHIDTLPEDWSLAGEGGGTLVLRYGGLDESLAGLVLRIPKRTLASPTGAWHADRRILDFYRKGIRVTFSKQWLLIVLKNVALQRNPARLAQCPLSGGMINEELSGVLVPDLIAGTSLAIEIKPKWHGALAYVKSIARESISHHRLCRHCNTHHAMPLPRVRYCPADLFSNKKRVIERALWALSRFPKNNFAVYKGGARCDPSALSTTEVKALASHIAQSQFLQLLLAALQVLWDPFTPVDDQVLIDAACLRDCSFIVKQSATDSSMQIAMIDIDGKDIMNIPRYKEERLEMLSSINSISLRHRTR